MNIVTRSVQRETNLVPTLSATALRVIHHLSENPGSKRADLADAIPASSRQINHMVRYLINLGYVWESNGQLFTKQWQPNKMG